MILNSEDVYDNIESYRNKQGYSQDKMAEIIGMSGKSAYSAMIKNRRMKFEYLINLLNNSTMTVDQLFRGSTKYEHQQSKKGDVEEIDTEIKAFSCTDCVSKQKEIELLKLLLDTKDELLNKYKEEAKKETSATRGAQAG